MQTHIAFSVLFLAAAINVLYAIIILWHRRLIPRHNGDLSSYPPVNIFLTLSNLDDGLEENLVSVFSIEYPHFTVSLAVDSFEDPCMKVVERVRARFPDICATIEAVGHSNAHNPKVNKLSILEKRTGAPLMWVLDSDIRVDRQTLKSLVGEYLKHDAKLVFSPIRSFGANTFGSLIEMSYLNFYMSGSILTAWKLFRQRVVIGKSLLIERAALESIGGFGCFADVIAEDYWLGETFFNNGFGVRCNVTWVSNVKETTSLKNYFQRMSRWAKLRFSLNLPAFALEIFLNPIAIALVAIPFLQNRALPTFLVIILLQISLEYAVFFAINPTDRKRLRIIAGIAPAVVAKDIIMLFVYFIPIFSHRIVWRGSTIRIGKRTKIIFNRENLLYDKT